MTRMVRTLCTTLAVAMMLAAFAGSAIAEESGYVVIVNADNSTDSIGREELSRIFLKKVKRWPNGTEAVPVDLYRASPIRAAFTKGVHDRSMSAIGSYWQKQIFSGRGVPPVELGSDNEVLAFVKSNPGAVGYVSDHAPTAGVKVLQVR